MDRTIVSQPLGFTVTPFSTVITVTEIYVPGTYQGWDPSTALSIPSTEISGIYQGILNFPENALDFKITLDRSWEENYGGDGNGNLIFDGSNLLFHKPVHIRLPSILILCDGLQNLILLELLEPQHQAAGTQILI